MLTYRTGVAGGPSAAVFMADHLLEQTVPASQAALARYYNQTPSAEKNDVSTAEIGNDIEPDMLSLLGLTPGRAVRRDGIACLLAGLRADGKPVEGKQIQAGSRSIAESLGFSGEDWPDEKCLRQASDLLCGSGDDFISGMQSQSRRAAERLFSLYGIPAGCQPDATLFVRLAAGRSFDGKPLDRRSFLDAVTASKARIGYIDLTWSADKSVSLAWAFARTQAERAMILQAHRDAVDTVMRQVRHEIGRARKGKAGKKGYEAGQIGWLRFDHFTSRPTVELPDVDAVSGESFTRRFTLRVPGDPQLHTHTVVPNVVLTESGRVGGLDLKRLSGRVKELGALYQAFLAQNLRALGAEVELDRKTGAARLMVVPETVREAFSKRTQGGLFAARTYAKAQGLDWESLDESRRIALLKQGTQGDPRQVKQDDLADFEVWQRQADALGWTVPLFVGKAGRSATQASVAHEHVEAAFALTCDLLAERFRQKAVLEESDARICAVRALVETGIRDAGDVDAVLSMLAARRFRHDGAETSLIWVEDTDPVGERRLRVTTQLHVDRENDLIRLARQAASDRSGALSAGQIEAGIAATGLDFNGEHGESQRRAMHALGAEGRLSVLVGVAGSGKTTLLRPLVQAWHQAGRTIWGTAVAWRQAEDLAGAGIDRENLRATHPLLKDIQEGRITLDAASVVVLDELSLLSTTQLLDLLRARGETGFRLVMIGDPLQCQAVEAGPVVDLLRRALGADALPELLTSVRQQSERERTTALMLRDGNTREALQRKWADQTLLMASGDSGTVMSRIADLWLERYQSGRARQNFSLTVSAPTNAEARNLARVIRERRRQMGEIGEDATVVEAVDQHGVTYDMTLAVGDRVRLFARTNCHRTDGKRGILGNNGSVLRVIAIDSDGISLRNGQGTEGFVTWKTLAAPDSGRIRLGYGDVLSIDATQGLTSTEHIEAMPCGSKAIDAHRAYTQGSRHRERTWLVTSEGAERREIAGRRPLGDSRPIRQADILDNMARNMKRRDKRSSALGLLDSVREVRQQTLRDFQGAMLSVERRSAAGNPPTLTPAIARHRRSQSAGPVYPLADAIREELSGIKAATGRTETLVSAFVKDLTRGMGQVFGKFRDRLRHWRLRRALGEARRRTENGAQTLWRRVERELTEEDIPEWGSDAYFGSVAKAEMERNGSISMARAAALHEGEMWRKQDARRLDPAGNGVVSRRVDWLFQLAGIGNAAPDNVLSIILPSRSSDRTDVFDSLRDDLHDMGIDAGRDADVLHLKKEELSNALAAFEVEAVCAVCDRLLLARFARRTRPADHERSRIIQQEPHRVVWASSRRRSGPDLTD
ncbi:MobF family relaxase [Acetobacter sp. DsW_059]|uniref:MobF family relaxase n=1 Tax=Acetobacter sp. DsW_059 TaxID=1670661 RepID=UPI000A39DD09|nr:MobF family relaxase [Acetobacter sp. DsW_059]